jgi:hypothetical protein
VAVDGFCVARAIDTRKAKIFTCRKLQPLFVFASKMIPSRSFEVMRSVRLFALVERRTWRQVVVGVSAKAGLIMLLDCQNFRQLGVVLII